MVPTFGHVYTSFSFAFLCFIFTLGSINCLQLKVVKVQSACASPGLVFIQVTILSFNLYKTISKCSIFLYQDYRVILILQQLYGQQQASSSLPIRTILYKIFMLLIVNENCSNELQEMIKVSIQHKSGYIELLLTRRVVYS